MRPPQEKERERFPSFTMLMLPRGTNLISSGVSNTSIKGPDDFRANKSTTIFLLLFLHSFTHTHTHTNRPISRLEIEYIQTDELSVSWCTIRGEISSHFMQHIFDSCDHRRLISSLFYQKKKLGSGKKRNYNFYLKKKGKKFKIWCCVHRMKRFGIPPTQPCHSTKHSFLTSDTNTVMLHKEMEIGWPVKVLGEDAQEERRPSLLLRLARKRERVLGIFCIFFHFVQTQSEGVFLLSAVHYSNICRFCSAECALRCGADSSNRIKAASVSSVQC